MAAEVWVATAPIWLGNVRAYNLNNIVPDSVVTQFGLESAGLVERRPASDTGVPSHGVDPATQLELDNAIVSRAAVSEVFAGDGKFRVDKLPSVVPRTINGKTATGNGDVVLTAGDIGALPVGTTAADIGALPLGTTAASLGALPSSTTARDIGGLDQLLGDARYPLKSDLFFNVRHYGAKGDGAADDTLAIRSALTAAATAGGVVFIPAGTYLVVGLLSIASNVSVWGAGRQATIVKLANGANADIFQTASFTTKTLSGTVGGAYNWSVRYLTIEGNKANNTSGRGMSVYGADWDITDISIRNCASDGLYTEWVSQGSTSPPDRGLEARIRDVRIHDNGGWGWWNRGPHDSMATNAVICNNVAGNYWSQTWGSAIVQAGSVGVALSAGLSITVDHTLGWPASGTCYVPVSAGGTIAVPFSSVTPTTIVVGSNPPAGTIAAGSILPNPGVAGAKGYSSAGTVMTNCHFWGAACPVSVILDDVTFFVNCQVEGAPTGQILWRCTDGEFIGGAIYTSPGGAPGYGIKLGDPAYAASVIAPVRNLIMTRFSSFLNDGTSANASIWVARSFGSNTIIATSTGGQAWFGTWSTSDRVQILGTAVTTSLVQYWGNTNLNGHLTSVGNKPTVAVGTGFTTTVVDLGTDTSFEITSTNGAAASTALGSVAYVTYNSGYPSGGVRQVVFPYNAAAAEAGLYISARTATTFTVSAQNAVPANAVLKFGVVSLG